MTGFDDRLQRASLNRDFSRRSSGDVGLRGFVFNSSLAASLLQSHCAADRHQAWAQRRLAPLSNSRAGKSGPSLDAQQLGVEQLSHTKEGP